MERLYSLRVDGKLLVSNSLAYLLEATRSRLDVRDWSYESTLMTFLRGYRRAASTLRIADGRTVHLHYHRSVVVDEHLSFGGLDPPEPPAFADYAHYVGYLVATLSQLVANGADAARRVKYEPLATISSGYDSPACAVLAQRVGCREAVTFGAARQAFAPTMESEDDSGEAIGGVLGLAVDTYSRDAYLESSGYPEAAFIATGSGGDDVVLSALGTRLERTMLFTGMLGDTLWGTESQDPRLSREYRFRYPAGGSMQEHRLTTGFVHVPIPLLTFTRHAEIQAISRSPEMSAWRLGTRYDRPIPRRLIEEAGMPRDAFAREKRAITQPFWLQRATPACMSRASLVDFHGFVARCVVQYPLGALQMHTQNVARKAYYKLRRQLRRLEPADPYYSPAYEAVATSEPLRFHWSIERRRAAYRSTKLARVGGRRHRQPTRSASCRQTAEERAARLLQIPLCSNLDSVKIKRGANDMQKTTIALTSVIAGLLIAFFVSDLDSPIASAQSSRAASYAEERALIENLQARYLFALDFKDHDLYVTTFTPDGILDVGNGEVVGREAIKAAVANMPGGRHHVTNLVLRIDGDRATARAAWMHTGKNAEGRMTIGGFGHYEDDLVKVNGEWLFARRRIYNEGRPEWAAPPGNPAW